jgi:hypothetical protein
LSGAREEGSKCEMSGDLTLTLTLARTLHSTQHASDQIMRVKNKRID